MSKCDNCNRNINKRSPGLECSKCGKLVHASQICCNLSAKQLAALRNAENLDWTCQECQCNSSRRGSSFIIPEEDEDEEEEVNKNLKPSNFNAMDVDKFMHEITNEMKKILKRQLEPIEQSTNACCKKIEEIRETLEKQNEELKELKKKFINVSNKNTHLELKVGMLQQQIRKIEQDGLKSVVELKGIPKVEDLATVTTKLAHSINKDKSDINNMVWIDGKNDRGGYLQIEFKNAELANKWTCSAKKGNLTVSNIINNAPNEIQKSKVYFRKALTKYNKSLLWKAQHTLRPDYKYIWFQDGKVLARKDDNEKIIIIRESEEIERLCVRPSEQQTRR